MISTVCKNSWKMEISYLVGESKAWFNISGEPFGNMY